MITLKSSHEIQLMRQAGRITAAARALAGAMVAPGVSTRDPGHRVLREGDIVSVDVGAYKDGFHGDCAATYPCGEISEEARRLIEVTRQSFFEGLRYAREGYRLPDLSGCRECEEQERQQQKESLRDR